MRILQVSPSDTGGGAENVAMTLHREYLRRGHHSALVVGYRHTGEDGISELAHNAARGAWARSWRTAADALVPLEGRVRGARRIRETLQLAVAEPNRWWGIRRGREDFDFPATAGLVGSAGAPPDILHLHNLHWEGRQGRGYFDLRALPALSRAHPLVLTLHDAWLLSGHCAHSFDCERWLTGCGECPDLSIYPSVRRDATAFNWLRKREIYAQSRLRVAAPSHWLMDKAERSVLTEGIVETRVIPNGVDTSVFRPGDRSRARSELGLPLDATIVMLAANALHGSGWKDVPLMNATLEAIADVPLVFLAIGEDAAVERHGRAVVRFVPPQEQMTLARYYQAADVYLHPARAETFGIVLLEAMACATPVVATAVGGIPEVVTDGHTGLLVPPGDAHALVEALRTLIADDAGRIAMGAAGVADVGRRFALSRMVDAYLEWYAEVVAETAPVEAVA